MLVVVQERVEWDYLVSAGPKKYHYVSDNDFYYYY